MGDALDFLADYVAPAALAFVPGVGPALSAVYTGVRSGVETGNPLSGLLSAGGSFAGNALGSSLGSSLGNSFGGALSETPGNALGNVFGGEAVGAAAPFGSMAGNALGSSTIGSLAGGALGSNAGNSIGKTLGGQINPMSPNTQDPTPFSPTRAPQQGLPQSLSQFSGSDPFQQATGIATKGVYGGGNGGQENNYFLNLINRQLTDDGSKGMGGINPVESSYLSQLGLGGYNNSNDLLKGIQGYAG